MEIVKKMIMFVVVLVFLLIGLGMLYQFGGLKYYLKAYGYVISYKGEKAQLIKNDFFGEKNKGLYNGILAGVWTGKNPGVWMWTNNFLRFFPVDKYSVFSYYEGCKPEFLEPTKKEGFSIKRDILVDLDTFLLRVGKKKEGLFVSVMITGKDQGGKVGNLRELWANDWWVFMNTDLKIECKK